MRPTSRIRNVWNGRYHSRSQWVCGTTWTVRTAVVEPGATGAGEAMPRFLGDSPWGGVDHGRKPPNVASHGSGTPVNFATPVRRATPAPSLRESCLRRAHAPR